MKREESVLRKTSFVLRMHPMLDGDALYSDETQNYLDPMEPGPGEKVRVRLRTAADNIDEVCLVTDEKRFPMRLAATDGQFDFYETEVQLGEETFRYWFEVSSGQDMLYYSKEGPSRALRREFLFSIHPGFSTPDWAKGAVMYQIFTDRFRNGDPSNDVLDGEYAYIREPVHRIADWNALPEPMDVRNFYGGDLQGVMDKLDYLQDLGVEVIYFNPLFVSPSNHKYDIQDYDHIDPHFGKIVVDDGEVLPRGSVENRESSRYIRRVTDLRNLEASNEFFARLVEEIHRRGMRVILDGVFNHCGSFNKWMDRERLYEGVEGYKSGAYVSADSPYRSFFHFNSNAWPYNDSYEGWWGVDTLPKLNYEESDKLVEYILRIGKKWVSPPYNADGWRLDVAADLGRTPQFNHKMWKMFRKAVKEAKPDAIILAEHYGDPSEWLQGDEWDTVMNYDAFMEPLTWFFTGMEKHSDYKDEHLYGNAESFLWSMRLNMARLSGPSLLTSMNELSNHDHSRFLTRTNRVAGRTGQFSFDAASEGVKPAVMREAVVFQMTWPGAPTIYYGDEAGVCGFTDPDNRRTYPWGHEDREMLRFHKGAIALHRGQEVLRRGSTKILFGSPGTFAFGRFCDSCSIIIAFNNAEEEKELVIRVTPAQVHAFEEMTCLLTTDKDGFSFAKKTYRCEGEFLKITVGPLGAAVLRTGDRPLPERI